MPEYTDRELMVIAAGREIRDGDLVFVGMRLPLLAFAFAKRTHAPGAIGLFENGIVRDQPAAETLMTMSDTPNIPGALWSTGLRRRGRLGRACGAAGRRPGRGHHDARCLSLRPRDPRDGPGLLAPGAERGSRQGRDWLGPARGGRLPPGGGNGGRGGP